MFNEWINPASEIEFDDDDVPFVSYAIMSYLHKQFSLNYLLTKDMGGCSEAMRLGYIKGVRDVLDCLENCIANQEAGKET